MNKEGNDSTQRLKLLKLWEILEDSTDRDHPMTAAQLIGEMELQGISCERRTLYKDIRLLEENGYPVVRERVGRSHVYYTDKRVFTLAELRFLMDTVQSTQTLPEEQTAVLLDKIASLGGAYRKTLLKQSLICFDTVKSTNEEILDTISQVETAVTWDKEISFVYFHYDRGGRRVFRHNKIRYREQPLGTYYADGRYYLFCFRPEREYAHHVQIFRLDRMLDVRVEKADITDEAKNMRAEIIKLPRTMLRMYSGEIERVVLRFKPELTEIIYDRFGMQTPMVVSGADYLALVHIQISPTFYGWLTQFPGEIMIDAPDTAAAEYQKWLRRALRRQCDLSQNEQPEV